MINCPYCDSKQIDNLESKNALVCLKCDKLFYSDFLKTLYEEIKYGRNENAIDLVFNKFDNLFLDNKFDEADKLLSDIDVDKLNLDLVVGVLSVTKDDKMHLKSRSKFVDDCFVFVKKRASDRSNRLLEGLT